MPYAAPRHCPRGHAPFTGPRCPECAKRAKAEADKRRPSARERGYTKDWERESKAFLAAHPVCIACGSPATVVDHLIPHRGNQKLFWMRENWRPMCKPCHDRKTAQRDGAFKRQPRSYPGGGVGR
jgi:5-methylcytosine-specific restriction endonuclease McrA